jgi:hypothetical protein
VSDLFDKIVEARQIGERNHLAYSATATCQKVPSMSRNLTLPDELFNKLARGAAQRDLSVEALLAFVSELVVLPDQPTAHDRKRYDRIERLFAKYRAGPLTAPDRTELDRLIDADYQEANARADRLIAAKEARPAASRKATAPPVHSSRRSTKHSQK